MIDMSMSARSAGAKRMPQTGNETVTMMAPQRETAGASAKSANTDALGASDWLSLAAAPSFALMALLTGIFDSAQPAFLCSAASHALSPSGMLPMYVLMSAFHSAPWLKRIAHW